MGGDAGKDRGSVNLAAVRGFKGEIERLQAEIARLEAQVRELDRLAYHDPLLDLPNRRSLLRDLDQIIALVERYGTSAALIFVDVDGLKRINDQFGHAAGDAALVEIARLLVESVRKSDRVARLAGDEFGILMPRADELSAWHMALRIVETVVGAEFSFNGNRVPLSVAVGVGLIQPGDDPAAVLTRADQAMYRIKAA